MAALPAEAAGANPLDLRADAPPERYAAALDALAADPGVDALLVMHAPNVLADPLAVAEAVAGRVERRPDRRQAGLRLLDGRRRPPATRAGALRAAGVASYDTPAAAAAAVGHLTDWGRAQAALLQVPDRGDAADAAAPGRGARPGAARCSAPSPPTAGASLTEPEATEVLAAYGIPAPELRRAATPAAVAAEAAAMLAAGGRVVVKLVSAEVAHKSELGGVALDVATAAEAEAAARAIAARAAAAGVGDRRLRAAADGPARRTRSS